MYQRLAFESNGHRDGETVTAMMRAAGWTSNTEDSYWHRDSYRSRVTRVGPGEYDLDIEMATCPDCGGTGIMPIICCSGYECGCRGQPVDFDRCPRGCTQCVS